MVNEIISSKIVCLAKHELERESVIISIELIEIKSNATKLTFADADIWDWLVSFREMLESVL